MATTPTLPTTAPPDRLLVELKQQVSRVFQGMQNCADRWKRHSKRAFTHAQILVNHYIELDIVSEPGPPLPNRWGALSQFKGLPRLVVEGLRREIQAEMDTLDAIVGLLLQVVDAMDAHVGLLKTKADKWMESGSRSGSGVGEDDAVFTTIGAAQFVALAHEIETQYRKEFAVKKAVLGDLPSCEGMRGRSQVYLAALLMEPCIDDRRIDEIISMVEAEESTCS